MKMILHHQNLAKLLKPSDYFPHIIRRFSADKFLPSFGKLFWLSFAAFAFLNIYSYEFFPKTPEKDLKFQIMRTPVNSQLHEKLGLYYLPINKMEAYKEYLLAQEYYKESSSYKSGVLGLASQPMETWGNFDTAEKNTLKEIGYWEDITKNLPEYQYARLKIASLFIELGDKTHASEYLQQILQNTPSDNTALMLADKLKRAK